MLTTSQWDDWRAIAAIEPLGDDRLDILFARLAADIRAAWVGKTQVSDHLIDWYRGRQTPEEIDYALRCIHGV